MRIDACFACRCNDGDDVDKGDDVMIASNHEFILYSMGVIRCL